MEHDNRGFLGFFFISCFANDRVSIRTRIPGQWCGCLNVHRVRVRTDGAAESSGPKRMLAGNTSYNNAKPNRIAVAAQRPDLVTPVSCAHTYTFYHELRRDDVVRVWARVRAVRYSC